MRSPITFFYTEDPGDVAKAAIPKGWSCIISELALVRNGKSLAWNLNSLTCGGSKRILVIAEDATELRVFSYHTDWKQNGRERYIQSPKWWRRSWEYEMYPAKGKYIVFKRFDNLTPEDEPVAVIFFATQDILSDCLHWPTLTRWMAWALLLLLDQVVPPLSTSHILKMKKKIPKLWWVFLMYRPGHTCLRTGSPCQSDEEIH